MAKDGTNRGGARAGAGRKKKPLSETLAEGRKGEVIALYPLMPNRMTVNRDETGQLYYQYLVSADDAHTMKHPPGSGKSEGLLQRDLCALWQGIHLLWQRPSQILQSRLLYCRPIRPLRSAFHD